MAPPRSVTASWLWPTTDGGSRSARADNAKGHAVEQHRVEQHRVVGYMSALWSGNPVMGVLSREFSAQELTEWLGSPVR